MAELKDLLVNGQSHLIGDAIYKTHELSIADDRIASTLYVKNAVNATLTKVLTYKGTVGTGGTVSVLPTNTSVGWVYVVCSSGNFAGKNCEPGDYIICNTTTTSATNSNWDVITGENQVENKDATLAVNSSITIAVVDGTNITLNVPNWEGVNKTGTITSVKMNGTTTSSGAVDLGTVLTTVASTGSANGNAITAVYQNGNKIYVAKDSSFAAYDHNHDDKYVLIGSETTLSLSTSGTGNAITTISVEGHTITVGYDSSFATLQDLIDAEYTVAEHIVQLHGDVSVLKDDVSTLKARTITVTTSGEGNVVTGIDASGHLITVTKGTVSSDDEKQKVTAKTSGTIYLSGVTTTSNTAAVGYADPTVKIDNRVLTATSASFTNTTISSAIISTITVSTFNGVTVPSNPVFTDSSIYIPNESSTATTVLVGGIANGTPVADVSGLTISQVLDKMLFPDAEPSLTGSKNFTFSIRSAYSTIVEYGSDAYAANTTYFTTSISSLKVTYSKLKNEGPVLINLNYLGTASTSSITRNPNNAKFTTTTTYSCTGSWLAGDKYPCKKKGGESTTTSPSGLAPASSSTKSVTINVLKHYLYGLIPDGSLSSANDITPALVSEYGIKGFTTTSGVKEITLDNSTGTSQYIFFAVPNETGLQWSIGNIEQGPLDVTGSFIDNKSVTGVSITNNNVTYNCNMNVKCSYIPSALTELSYKITIQ